MEDKVLFEQAFGSHGKSFKRIQQTVSLTSEWQTGFVHEHAISSQKCTGVMYCKITLQFPVMQILTNACALEVARVGTSRVCCKCKVASLVVLAFSFTAPRQDGA